MRSFYPILFLVLLTFPLASCDSGDPMIDDQPKRAAAGVVETGVAAKWSGCAPSDPYCEVRFTEGGVEWIVSFEGFDYDAVADRTTYHYDIFMPEGASQSGKVAMEAPVCCTWSGDLYSDGNRNDNAANDVEFNTSSYGTTNVNYVFDGDLYIGPIQVGLKVNSQTNPDTVPIYGPAPWPVYTFTGFVFLDQPESETVGPNGAMNGTEGGLDAFVTITTPNGTVETVEAPGGVYSYSGRQGTYTVEVLPSLNPGLFTTRDYLPTTSMTGSVVIGPDGPGPDFGFMESYSLSGGVFLNQPGANGDPGNSAWDADEPGISGIEVGLYKGGVLQASTLTGANGMFLFEGLGWDTFDAWVVNAGSNAGLFSKTAFTPTLTDQGGYFSLFSGLMNGDKSGYFLGFEVNTAQAAKALEDGLATTNGLPREYWKVQVSGKGSPKYRIPDYSFDQVQGFLNALDSFHDGGLPAALGLSNLSLDEALQIVKTESSNNIYEALRTEILVALLNWASGKGTLTIDGETFETRFFIDHGITLLMNAGYPNPGVGKISSGSVAAGESLLEETNGG